MSRYESMLPEDMPYWDESRANYEQDQADLANDADKADASVLHFSELTLANKARARAMFLGADNGDGYVYEVALDGVVLSRRPWHYDKKLDRALGILADRMVGK